MNIRSTRVDQLAQQLARVTGEDVETALERAIEERLSRVAPPAPADRKAALDTFFERVSRCAFWIPGRWTKSWVMTVADCRPDGSGYVRDHRYYHE
jgi:antitoxin VapB